jgi:hypothetical protein
VPKYDTNALVLSAFAILLDKAGGAMNYTQSEFAAIVARRGEYQIEADVDKSGPGEPVVRVKIVPKAGAKMPVS